MKSLYEAMLDPDLFGNSFGGDTFAAWRTVAKILDGLPLDDRELALYRQITGRQEPPTEPFREAYLIKPRRAGGTLFAATLGLHAALQDYRDRLGRGEVATVAMIASDRRQARQLMNYVDGLIADSPVIAAEVSGRTLETISFAHRVNLEVHTTSFRSTRGYSYVAVILDEMAFFRDDLSANPDVELVRAVRPGLANLGGRLLGLSSPHSRRGYLYQVWQQYYGKPSDVLVIQAGGPTLNPTINSAVIDRARAEDPVAARSEWDAQFREDVSQYLTDELIEAAMPGRLKRGPRLSSVAFVDMSGGVTDAAALGIAHSEAVDGETIVLLDHLEVVPAPHKPAAVAAQFAETLKGLGLNRVTGDRYAAGWCSGAFEKHGIHYESAELDKSAIYGEVLPLFSEQRCELPEDQRLVTELRLLERKPRAGGRPDNVDHPPRAHDDAANAACGALWLAMREQTTLERPGAYIKVRQLLAGARRILLPSGVEAPEGLREPILMPAFLDGSFACIAGGVGADADSIGAVFFGTNVNNPDCAPIVVLDWVIEELGAYTFDVFLDAIAARLESLIATSQQESGEEKCLFLGNMTGFTIGGILIEPEGVGAVLAALKQLGNAGRPAESLWKNVAGYSKSVLSNTMRVTEQLLKWGTILGGGLIGGSLFGITRMASDVAGYRRSAMGLGMSIGGMRSFDINMARLGNPRSFLEATNQALMNPALQSPLSALGANPTGSTEQVSISMLKAMRRLALATPLGLLWSMADAYQLGPWGGGTELQILKRMSNSEFGRMILDETKNRSALGISDPIAKKWTDFTKQMDLAGATIFKTFVVGLAPLAGP